MKILKKIFHRRNAIKIPFYSSSKTNRRETKKSRRRLKRETLRESRRKRKSVCFMTASNVGKEIVNSWSLLTIGSLANMPKPKEIHQKAVPRLFTREQNDYISRSMEKEPLYNFLANVAAPFCTTQTGSLYMHPAETFVNGVMLTDDIRKNTGSAHTPIISLVNNNVNEIIWATAPNLGTGMTYRAFPTTDMHTGKETPIVKNMRVLIGTPSMLTLEHSGIEEYNPTIEELRNYCMEQNEELTTEILKISKSSEFRTMEDILHNEAYEYVSSDEYVRPYLLREETEKKAEMEETRQKLSDMTDDIELSEEDKEILLPGIYQLVENHDVGEPSRKIKTNATQHKIYHVMHKMYKETNTDKGLWLKLIKNYFTKFENVTEEVLSKNFHQYPEFENRNRRSV